MWTTETLNAKSYKQVQGIARELGIKTRQKHSVLCAAILAHTATTFEATNEATANAPIKHRPSSEQGPSVEQRPLTNAGPELVDSESSRSESSNNEQGCMGVASSVHDVVPVLEQTSLEQDTTATNCEHLDVQTAAVKLNEQALQHQDESSSAASDADMQGPSQTDDNVVLEVECDAGMWSTYSTLAIPPQLQLAENKDDGSDNNNNKDDDVIKAAKLALTTAQPLQQENGSNSGSNTHDGDCESASNGIISCQFPTMPRLQRSVSLVQRPDNNGNNDLKAAEVALTTFEEAIDASGCRVLPMIPMISMIPIIPMMPRLHRNMSIGQWPDDGNGDQTYHHHQSESEITAAPIVEDSTVVLQSCNEASNHQLASGDTINPELKEAELEITSNVLSEVELLQQQQQLACAPQARTPPQSADKAAEVQMFLNVYKEFSDPLHSDPLHSGPLHSGPLHSNPLDFGTENVTEFPSDVPARLHAIRALIYKLSDTQEAKTNGFVGEAEAETLVEKLDAVSFDLALGTLDLEAAEKKMAKLYPIIINVLSTAINSKMYRQFSELTHERAEQALNAILADETGISLHMTSITTTSNGNQTKNQLFCADQSVADTDQSVADTDQSVADTDQSVADTDQSVADTDQSVADTDQLPVDQGNDNSARVDLNQDIESKKACCNSTLQLAPPVIKHVCSAQHPPENNGSQTRDRYGRPVCVLSNADSGRRRVVRGTTGGIVRVVAANQ
jgi:hypothetical protein